MRIHMEKRSLVGICLAAIGCGAPTEHGARLVLSTDQASYVAHDVTRDARFPQFAFTVITRVDNAGDAPGFLPRCVAQTSTPIYGIAQLAPIDPDGSAYNPAWACVGGVPPVRIEPGASRVDTLHLVGPTAFKGGGGPYIGTLSGRVRLSYLDGVWAEFTIATDTVR